MGQVSYGGQPCLDPVALANSLRPQRVPIDAWWGRANSFRCPLGQEPGRGLILLSRDSLDSLDLDQPAALVFALAAREISGVASAAQKAPLASLSIVRAQCVAPGLRGFPDAPYLVEIVDRRWFFQAGVVNQAFNLRSTPGTSPGCYLSATLNFGTAWTWEQMAAAVWLAAIPPDDFPGLPFTPNGTPEGFNFYGSNAYDSLGLVLERIGCALKYDPIADAFSIVQVAVTDATSAAALTALDAQRVWDADWIEANNTRLPQYLRVWFPIQRTTPDATGGSPYHPVDVTDPTAGGPLTTPGVGTYAEIHDDLAATYDATPALTNGAALTARANERATNYFRRARQMRGNRSFIGPRTTLLPAAQVRSTTWADRGSGWVAETETVPDVDGPWPFGPRQARRTELARRVLTDGSLSVQPTGGPGGEDSIILSSRSSIGVSNVCPIIADGVVTGIVVEYRNADGSTYCATNPGPCCPDPCCGDNPPPDTLCVTLSFGYLCFCVLPFTVSFPVVLRGGGTLDANWYAAGVSLCSGVTGDFSFYCLRDGSGAWRLNASLSTGGVDFEFNSPIAPICSPFYWQGTQPCDPGYPSAIATVSADLSACGSGSGSGGGGGHTFPYTGCCPGVAWPDPLHLTITSGSLCAALDGTYTLAYQSSSQTWTATFTYGGDTCQWVFFCAEGGLGMGIYGADQTAGGNFVNAATALPECGPPPTVSGTATVLTGSCRETLLNWSVTT